MAQPGVGVAFFVAVAGLLAAAGALLLGRQVVPASGGLPRPVVATTGTSGGDVWLGRYFRLSEFTRSSTAAAQGIDNTPSSTVQAALRALVNAVLDPVREAVGKPVNVTSGYRSPALNSAVGGQPDSQHIQGEAADIMVDGMTATQLADRIDQAGIVYDQLITYKSAGKPHVHVSWDAGRAPRRQRLVL